MYEAFDSFLNTDNWYRSNVQDEERFYRALSAVVQNADFNADNMGHYFREQKGEHYAGYISRMVSQADAVRGYLQATNSL